MDIDIGTLISVLVQLGLAASAYRLANALKIRVDDHETRIIKLEGVH